VADYTGFDQQLGVALAIPPPDQDVWLSHGHGLVPVGNSWSRPLLDIELLVSAARLWLTNGHFLAALDEAWPAPIPNWTV